MSSFSLFNNSSNGGSKARKRGSSSAALDPRRVNTIYWNRADDSINELHQACLNSDVDVIERILASTPQMIDLPSTRRKDTPLIYAIYYCRNVDLLKRMIRACPQAAERKSSPEGLFGSEITPLHLAIEVNASPKIIASLIRASPTTLTEKNSKGLTPYELALRIYDNPRARVRILARLQGEKPERRDQSSSSSSDQQQHKKRPSFSIISKRGQSKKKLEDTTTSNRGVGAHHISKQTSTTRRSSNSLIGLLKRGM